MLDRTGTDETAGQGGALREALRRARAEAAEQTDVVVGLRHAEIARLALLREELEPVFAQTPREVDIFDLGLVPGDRPRLFVDMVAFVEMARDKRTYRFMRDGRYGRSTIAESDRVDPIVEAVTAYVARRLIERERLLADDDRLAGLASLTAERGAPRTEAPAAAPAQTIATPVSEVETRRSTGWGRVLKLFGAFVIGAAIGGLVVVAVITAVAKGIIPL
ncbi:hypothetical protein IHQ68_15845 [Chelatococcus sambhunathii]|uniref:Uncharacterized protein n=1 Tax=Chelatococcus sambhunathii TaxID=363953 RepID=A0ABU1DIZ4_9HYPH|nr:hypothetical protein [Chelatococcus sambhunathii]MDR4308092.1 hypothetical protein [Chelatococcus sambhunathii]